MTMTEEIDETKISVPTSFEFALQVYDRLNELANDEPAANVTGYGYPAQPDEIVRVYRGHSSKDSQSVGLAPTTAQGAVKLLTAMRAITLLKMGHKAAPSIYLIHYRPKNSQYWQFRNSEEGLTRQIAPSRYDQLKETDMRLQDQIAELKGRLSELEAIVERLQLYVRPNV